MVIGFLKKRSVAKIVTNTVFFLSSIARKSRMYFFKGKKSASLAQIERKRMAIKSQLILAAAYF